MEKQKRKSNVGFWITISLLTVFLIVSLFVNAGLLIGMAAKMTGRVATVSGAVDEFPSFMEEWSYGEGESKAVRIAVGGLITRETESSIFAVKYDKIEAIIRQIKAASNDASVRAIIVEMNTPGGAITPSDEIYQALLDFKSTSVDRKVVVYMQDLAASGGYYIAMAGDYLIAQPTAVVGSIGVIMQSLNLKGLSEKIGITDTTIKSGKNKDLLNPFQDTNPEQLALLQELIDDMYGRFLNIVSTGRQIDPDDLKTLADGRIFTARQALDHGLIDQIGYWDDVVKVTTDILGESSVKIVRFQHRAGFADIFSMIHSPFNWSSALSDANTPRLMYLWRP